jgi:hypothetical protein
MEHVVKELLRADLGTWTCKDEGQLRMVSNSGTEYLLVDYTLTKYTYWLAFDSAEGYRVTVYNSRERDRPLIQQRSRY